MSDFTAFLYLGKLIEFGVDRARSSRRRTSKRDGRLHHGPLRLIGEEQPMPHAHRPPLRRRAAEPAADAPRAWAGSSSSQIARAIARSSSATPSSRRDWSSTAISEVNRSTSRSTSCACGSSRFISPRRGDLRFVTTALKVDTDLERIGDMAVNICERALELNEEPPLKPYIDIPRMAKEAAADGAHEPRRVRAAGHRPRARGARGGRHRRLAAHQIFRELLSYMTEDPKTISRATRILFVSKHLERIADHATNIAEMVVFMVNGKMIRHAALATARTRTTYE